MRDKQTASRLSIGKRISSFKSGRSMKQITMASMTESNNETTSSNFVDPLSSFLPENESNGIEDIADALLEGGNFAIDSSDEEDEAIDAVSKDLPSEIPVTRAQASPVTETREIAPLIVKIPEGVASTKPVVTSDNVSNPTASFAQTSSASLASSSLSSVTSTLSSLWNNSKIPSQMTSLGINPSNVNTNDKMKHMTANPQPQTMIRQTSAPPTTSNGILKLLLSHIESLLPGERVIMFLSSVKKVSDSANPVPTPENCCWCCAMTFYRIILFPYEEKDVSGDTDTRIRGGEWKEAELQQGASFRLIQMPLGSMDRVEKIEEEVDGKHSMRGVSTGVGTMSANWTLILHGKDNNRFLRFTTSTVNDSIRAHQTLNTYAFPGRRNLGYLFAFESRRSDVLSATGTPPSTRKRYDFDNEFHDRLELFPSAGNKVPSSNYVQVENTNYALCNSYPSWIVVPRKFVTDSDSTLITLETRKQLKRCASFRSENRLPALSWARDANSAGIWRCSQPKVGIQGNRCPEDEHFIRCMGEGVQIRKGKASGLDILERFRLTGGEESIENIESMLLSDNSPLTVRILDMRSKTSAMGNRGAGYGYENTNNYPYTSLSFCNITNIHGVRDAYNKISQLCLGTSVNDSQWGSLVEDTKWLHHIRLILQASWITAFHVYYHNLPVLVHCSHGWDRTSQVCAIAQIFLDPYYRTMNGFAVLVEKEFMSFGHPFHTRAGHGETKGERGTNASGHGGEGQVSPIFLQFLDSVYQVVRQFPNWFEFNLRYVLVISEHVYSCRFGTLLCDNERERELDASIRQRTHCLWEYLDACKDILLNEDYLGNQSGKFSKTLLLPPLPLLLRNVVLWGDRHLKWSPKPSWEGIDDEFNDRYLYRTTSTKGRSGSDGLKGEISNEETSNSRDKDVLSLRCSTDKMIVKLRQQREEIEKWKQLALTREKEIEKLKDLN